MEKIYCNAECDNVNCSIKLTQLQKIGSFSNNAVDKSIECEKYIKPFDEELDNLILRKIED